MSRGIERRSIFLDDEDRARFLWRLQRVLAVTGARCFAFALMSNHFHLLLEIGAVPLSRVMHRLGTAHASDFNRRHRRCGYLFQNRFRSKVLESEESFLAVLRYIHLNPVRARMVPDLAALARWRWTSHAALLGNLPAPFLEAREVLLRFGDDPREARGRYALWMAREDDQAESGALEPGGGLPIEGRPAALPDPGLLDRFSERNALQLDGWDLDRVIGVACARLGADETALRAGRRAKSVSRAREAVAWLASERLGVPQAAVARATGVSQQAISRARERAAACPEHLRDRFPELVV